MHRSRFILRALLGALILVALVPAAALGISRETVLARGKVWVDKHVPYSQTRWAKVDGTLIPATSTVTASKLGYRTDCSGFVSMCLALTDSKGAPRSLTTRTFAPNTVYSITKAALLPGDVILKPGHVMLFVGWVDSSQQEFVAYEERGTSYGTVRSTRKYSELYKWGYRAYRYRGIDEFYTDTQEAIYGLTRYETAVAASRVAFPETRTAPMGGLVVANGESWAGNLGGAALAGASGGPLLLTEKTSLPATAQASIRRLNPEIVFVIGGPSTVSTAVTEQIEALGPRVITVSGRDRYVTAARAASMTVSVARSARRTVDAAYLVGADAFCDGVAVSPIAAKTSRPILLTRRTSVPASTLDVLKKSGIKQVYVLGDKTVIAESVVTLLKKRGIRVERKAGANRYQTALSIAHHGAAIPDGGLSWNGLGVTSGTELSGALACGVAQGQAGSLLLFTPGTKLYSGTADEIAEQRAGISKVRVFGSYNAIGLTVRSSIAKLMRAK